MLYSQLEFVGLAIPYNFSFLYIRAYKYSYDASRLKDNGACPVLKRPVNRRMELTYHSDFPASFHKSSLATQLCLNFGRILWVSVYKKKNDCNRMVFHMFPILIQFCLIIQIHQIIDVRIKMQYNIR